MARLWKEEKYDEEHYKGYYEERIVHITPIIVVCRKSTNKGCESRAKKTSLYFDLRYQSSHGTTDKTTHAEEETHSRAAFF